MHATVIIPSFRGADRLPRLLNSLSAQTHADWDAVVVIDGDCDGSERVVSQFSHLPVRPIVLPENRGRVAALNTGFHAADGDILIRCDDDLEPAADYIHKHVSAHETHELGVVGLYSNQLVDNSYARTYGRWADEQHRQAAYSSDEGQRWRFWAGNCSVSRHLWESVGPYDERFHAYGWEDVDYGYRIALAGVPVVIDPDLETTHHVAAVTTEVRARRAYRSGQARSLFDQIHGAQVSGPAAPPPNGAWNWAVRKLASTLDYTHAQHLGRRVDSITRAAPPAVSRKLIALTVEASSTAGYHDHDKPSHDF